MERDAKAANGSAAAGCAGAACGTDDNPNRSVDAAGTGAAVGAEPWKW